MYKTLSKKVVEKDPRELWYRLLYFIVAIYPVWFLWRHKTNDHVYHWYASAIQALFVVDFALYHLLYSKNRAYVFYVVRDVVLNFTLATCLSLSLLQIVISHPRPNYLHNQNGILESEEDANILTGWFVLFMALIVWDKLKLHRRNVFQRGANAATVLLTEDYFYIAAAALTILSTIPLILAHCQMFGDGCNDANLNGTVV